MGKEWGVVVVVRGGGGGGLIFLLSVPLTLPSRPFFLSICHLFVSILLQAMTLCCDFFNSHEALRVQARWQWLARFSSNL